MKHWTTQGDGSWRRAVRGGTLVLYAQRGWENGAMGVVYYRTFLNTGAGDVDLGNVRGAPNVAKRTATRKLKAFLREVRGL